MPRAQQISLTPLQTMVDEAIDFMRVHEPAEGYTLADSFGKDSTVLLELARMAGVKFVHIHNRTGIDPPELYRFGRETRPNVRYIPPRMTMWEGIRTRFPPTIHLRWCCDVLKHGNNAGGILPTHTLVGIRAEESFRRRNKPRRDKMTDGKGFMVKPIFYWQEWHVWEFIESMNLPYCHLYDEGFDRLGCCVCPMITSSSMAKVNQHRKRWPGYYKAFEHVVTWWFWNKAWWNRFAWKRPERFINAWYRGFSGESPFKALKSPDVPDGQGTQLSFLNGKKRRVQYA